MSETSDLRIPPLRAYLAIATVANPLVGVVYAVVHPGMWDSWTARFVLSGMSLLALVGSFHPRLARHTSAMATICAWTMNYWYIARGRFAGFQFEHVLFLVLLAIISVAGTRKMVHVLPMVAGASLILAWAYGGPGPYVVSQGFVQTLLLLTYVTVALTLAHRASLENALDRANADLQRQVERLHHEVDVRAAAEREALQASLAKSAFLANMSHELRTPLNAIIGYSELVGETIEPDADPEARDDLTRILTSAHHLLSIIDDVLDIARIEADQLHLTLEPLDLGPLVAYCVEMVRPAAEARGNRLTVSVPERVGVRGDETRVKQVLLNLLANAAKYTERGEIAVEVVEGDDRVAIRVRDTGRGIPSDAVGGLFQKFTQVDASTTRTAGGVGLGLAIGHELASRMGGSLSVDTELGRGSTFTFVLPRAALPSVSAPSSRLAAGT